MNGNVDDVAARVATAKAASDHATAIVSHAQRARTVMVGLALCALIVLAAISLIQIHQQNQRTLTIVKGVAAGQVADSHILQILLDATGPQAAKTSRQELVNIYDCLIDQADLLAGRAAQYRVRVCP